MSVWDYCGPDPSCLVFLDEIAKASDSSFGKASSSPDSSLSSSSASSTVGQQSNDVAVTSKADIDGLQASILGAEGSCRNFIEVLDSILSILDAVASQFDDVTSRTNSLMSNAESLLEQQHNLQVTAETLKQTLAPFDDIEHIATLLGIPVDARGNITSSPLPGTGSSSGTLSSISSSATGVIDYSGGNSSMDPRSPEFHAALTRLSKALSFIRDHGDFCDSERYHRWLVQLQNRATSLIARSMKELLDNASKTCVDLSSKEAALHHHASAAAAAEAKADKAAGKDVGAKRSFGRSGIDDTTPLEAAPVYQKFRGLGFRMRELSALLQISASSSDENRSSNIRNRLRNIGRDYVSSNNNGGSGSSKQIILRTAQEILHDVKQTYVSIRTSLLMPFLKDTALNIAASAASTASQPDGRPKSTLCPGIRHAFSMLLRVTQLEFQLADSLFRASNNSSSSSGGNVISASDSADAISSVALHSQPSSSLSSSSSSTENILEVQSIVEALSNATGDYLRPFIIHESDVDELCRVVTTLAEDVRTQMMAMPIPRVLLRRLIHSLDRCISDAQERLAYCAEMRLRQEVQMFEPLPSQLAYPEILEKHAQSVKDSHQQQQQQIQEGVEAPANVPVEDASKTWYLPLKQTLALLSKLYGVIEMPVFEHYARRSVELCVQSLKAGSEGVKRTRSQLHGDLFLVRHLLVLREQLIPFEIRLQGVEMQLDFKPTGAALSHLAQSPRSILRFDVANGLLQLAWDGLPAIREMQVDARKNLDLVLKDACLGLKASAVKMLLGPLDAFLSKVTAFVGDIPVDAASGASTGVAGDMLASDGSDSVVQLPAEARASLKNQAFVRPERIMEMLDSVQSTAMQSAPDLRDIMKLYIDNSVARTILLKPVQQEIDLARRKTECVVASCIDPGQMRRDLEQLLQSATSAVIAQLTAH